MESHEFDELKSFEDLAARSRAERPPGIDVRLCVEAALSTDEMRSFEVASAKSRRETAPEVDVRLLVRAALLTAPRQDAQLDWMDVMVRLFRLPQVRLATTACLVGLFIAATAIGRPDAKPVDTAFEMDEDPVMAFLVTGQ